MGYAAVNGNLDMAAACLAAILYSWQFPHFNGLSWNLRGDYSRVSLLWKKSTYRPHLGWISCHVCNGWEVVSCHNDSPFFIFGCLMFRGSTAYKSNNIDICIRFVNLISTNAFCLDSLPVNAYLCYLSYQFYKAPDAKNSRKLFFFRYF